MKKLLWLVLAVMSFTAANAASDATSESAKKVEETTFKLYGFVRNYVCVDSRKNLQSGGDQFNQIPMDENLNAFGDDMNAIPTARFLTSTTRLGLNITGPEALGAKSSAKIEADFNAYSGTTMLLRFRQAYVKLDWEKSNILMGQAWHPMAGDMLPNVVSLASGSPFNPFSRSPQLRYNYLLNDITLTAVALYQYQYASVGPNGASVDYAKSSMVPELYAELKYQKNGFMANVGVDYLRIAPRSVMEDANVKVSEHVTGISPILSMSYNKDKFAFQLKSVYAQNTSHMSMMSGYGVTEELADGSRKYAPLRSSTSFLTLGYGKKYKAVLFLGYSKNLGAAEDFRSTADMYVRGYKNIDQMYRITPVFSYNLKHLNLALELERTTVAYGKDIKKNGAVADTHNVSNNRICAMVKYNF